MITSHVKLHVVLYYKDRYLDIGQAVVPSSTQLCVVCNWMFRIADLGVDMHNIRGVDVFKRTMQVRVRIGKNRFSTLDEFVGVKVWSLPKRVDKSAPQWRIITLKGIII